MVLHKKMTINLLVNYHLIWMIIQDTKTEEGQVKMEEKDFLLKMLSNMFLGESLCLFIDVPKI